MDYVNFNSEVVLTPVPVSHRAGGASVSGGIQNLTGHSPEQAAVVVNFALGGVVGLDLPRSASWILQQNHWPQSP